MKKIISIMVAVLMITSLTTAFASDNAYPTALSVVTEQVTEAVTGAITGTKLNISSENTTVTTDIMQHTSFGDITAIIDGIGMTYDNSRGQTYSGEDLNRWTSKNNSATGTITFTFDEAQTFNTIKWSEIRRVIKKVTVKAYSESADETPVAATVANFNDGVDATTPFGRMAAFDKTVTAKKVEFIIEDASLLEKVVSIVEMEFWNDSAAVTEETVTDTYHDNQTYAKDIKYIMNGVKYQGDGNSTLELTDRWVVPKDTKPTIIFNFYNKDITFDTIKYWEVRKQLTEYTITCYNDGAEVYHKEFTSSDTSNATTTYEVSITMGKCITADKVVLKVTGNAGLGVLSFCEFEFADTKSAPTITDDDGQNLDNQFNGSLIKNAFNGLYDNNPQSNDTTNRYQFLAYKLGCSKNDNVDDFNVKVPITIQFDLGENKTFNYAELSELRCILGEIEVYTSTDGSDWTKAGTMPKMAWSGSIETEFVHSVSFEPVTARYVKYIIKEIANYDDFGDERRTANINEISVCNYDVAETAIYPIRVYGKPLDENNSMIYPYTKDDETEYGLHNAVNANVVIKNSGTSDKTYMVLFAQYTAEDNRLVDAALEKVTLQAGQSTIQNVILKAGLKLQIQEVYGSRLACFVWDSVTIEPYTIAEKYMQPQYKQ